MSKSNKTPATTKRTTTKRAPTKQKVAPQPGAVVAAPAPAPAPAAPDVATRKIEKDRPEQNGVKQPSAGGACRAVWDFCTDASATTLVTAAQVKQAAIDNKWNPNNAMIEYYQWRKFNGIRGRQAKAVAPAPTEG